MSKFYSVIHILTIIIHICIKIENNGNKYVLLCLKNNYYNIKYKYNCTIQMILQYVKNLLILSNTRACLIFNMCV